jgi:uncharacterized protein (DUF1810 family)
MPRVSSSSKSVRNCGRARKEDIGSGSSYPQIKGLGYSLAANKFAISGRAEAEAYLNHPILGPRLRDCTTLVTKIEGRSIDQIFGYPDNRKFRSSMTLLLPTGCLYNGGNGYALFPMEHREDKSLL